MYEHFHLIMRDGQKKRIMFRDLMHLGKNNDPEFTIVVVLSYISGTAPCIRFNTDGRTASIELSKCFRSTGIFRLRDYCQVAPGPFTYFQPKSYDWDPEWKECVICLLLCMRRTGLTVPLELFGLILKTVCCLNAMDVVSLTKYKDKWWRRSLLSAVRNFNKN